MTTPRLLASAAAALIAAALTMSPCGNALLAAPAGKKPATGADAPPVWGAPANGFEIMLSLQSPASVNGKLVFHLQLRGAAGQAVKLPRGKPLFGWVLIGQNLGDTKRSFYSSKVAVVPVAWPEEVGKGETVQMKPIDLADSAAYPPEAARKLLTFYISGQGAQDLPPAAGQLTASLVTGLAFAKFTLCIPGGPDEKMPPMPVLSNTLEFMIGPPDYGALSPEAKKAFVADLLKQFDRSAWGGKQAHDAAVAIGGPLVPDLAAAVFDKERPDFSRLWLATTLADIRDDRAVDALIRLLDEGDGGAQAVAAYHGVKQESAKFDKALLEKIRSAQDGGLSAWALLGYMVFRGQVPEEILKAGLDSNDPKARAKAAEALAGRAGEHDVDKLLGLLQDKDPRVLGTAAAVLGKMRSKSPKIVEALVKALDTTDTSARQRLCEALTEVTGREGKYDPKADAAARAKTLADWKEWWATQSK